MLTGYYSTKNLSNGIKLNILEYVFNKAYLIGTTNFSISFQDAMLDYVKNQEQYELLIVDGFIKDQGILPPEICTYEVTFCSNITPDIYINFQLSQKEFSIFINKFKLQPCQI